MDILGNFNLGNLNIGAVSSANGITLPSMSNFTSSAELEKFLESFLKDFSDQIKQLSKKVDLGNTNINLTNLNMGSVATSTPDLGAANAALKKLQSMTPDLAGLTAQVQKATTATTTTTTKTTTTTTNTNISTKQPWEEYGITQAEWNRMITHQVNGEIKVLGHGAYDQYRGKSGLPPGAPSLDTYKKTLFIEGTSFDDSYARSALWAEYEKEIKTGKKTSYDGTLGGVLLGVREWGQ